MRAQVPLFDDLIALKPEYVDYGHFGPVRPWPESGMYSHQVAIFEGSLDLVELVSKLPRVFLQAQQERISVAFEIRVMVAKSGARMPFECSSDLS